MQWQLLCSSAVISPLAYTYLDSELCTVSVCEVLKVLLVARAVLVDFHPPMDAGTCLNVCEALSNTVAMIHHLGGPSRLPFFCLMVLGNYPEVGRLHVSIITFTFSNMLHHHTYTVYIITHTLQLHCISQLTSGGTLWIKLQLQLFHCVAVCTVTVIFHPCIQVVRYVHVL